MPHALPSTMNLTLFLLPFPFRVTALMICVSHTLFRNLTAITDSEKKLSSLFAFLLPVKMPSLAGSWPLLLLISPFYLSYHRIWCHMDNPSPLFLPSNQKYQLWLHRRITIQLSEMVGLNEGWSYLPWNAENVRKISQRLCGESTTTDRWWGRGR